MKFEFSRHILQKYKISKSVHVKPKCSVRTDRQTWRS